MQRNSSFSSGNLDALFIQATQLIESQQLEPLQLLLNENPTLIGYASKINVISTHAEDIHTLEKILSQDPDTLCAFNLIPTLKTWDLESKAYTLLEIACQVGNHEIFQFILNQSADYAKKEEKSTPIELIPITKSESVKDNDIATNLMLLLRLIRNPHLKNHLTECFFRISEYYTPSDMACAYDLNVCYLGANTEQLRFLIETSDKMRKPTSAIVKQENITPKKITSSLLELETAFIEKNKTAFIKIFNDHTIRFIKKEKIFLILKKWLINKNMIKNYCLLNEIGFLDWAFQSNQNAFEVRQNNEKEIIAFLEKLENHIRHIKMTSNHEYRFLSQFFCSFLKYSYSENILKANLIDWQDPLFPCARLLDSIPQSEFLEGALYALLTAECTPNTLDYFDFANTFTFPGFNLLLTTESEFKNSTILSRNKSGLPILIQMQNGEYHLYGLSHSGKPLYSSFMKNQFNIPNDWSFTTGEMVYIHANDPMYSILSHAHFITKTSITKLSDVVLKQLKQLRQEANISQDPPFIYIYGSAALSKLTHSEPGDIDVCLHSEEGEHAIVFPFEVKKTQHPNIDLFHKKIDFEKIEYDVSFSVRKGAILSEIKQSDFTIHHIFFNIFLNQHAFWTTKSKMDLQNKTLTPSITNQTSKLDETQMMRYLISSTKYGFLAAPTEIQRFQTELNNEIQKSSSSNLPFLTAFFAAQKMDSLFLKPSFLNGHAQLYINVAIQYGLLGRMFPIFKSTLAAIKTGNSVLNLSLDIIHNENPTPSTYKQKVQKSAKIIATVLFHFNRMNACTLDSIKKIKMEIKNQFSNKGLIREILISLDELIYQHNPVYQIHHFRDHKKNNPLNFHQHLSTEQDPESENHHIGAQIRLKQMFFTHLINSNLEMLNYCLVLHPHLIHQSHDITDRSGRLFTNISPLQYAYWVRDQSMTLFLISKMDAATALAQLEYFDQNHHLHSPYGASFQLDPIINFLHYYHENQIKLSLRLHCWKFNIGLLQKALPAWLALAMSKTDHLKWEENIFDCSKNNNVNSKTHDTHLDQWYGTHSHQSNLGIQFAFFRGDKNHLFSVPGVYAGHASSLYDLSVFEKLRITLEKEFTSIKSSLKVKCQQEINVNPLIKAHSSNQHQFFADSGNQLEKSNQHHFKY